MCTNELKVSDLWPLRVSDLLLSLITTKAEKWCFSSLSVFTRCLRQVIKNNLIWDFEVKTCFFSSVDTYFGVSTQELQKVWAKNNHMDPIETEQTDTFWTWTALQNLLKFLDQLHNCDGMNTDEMFDTQAANKYYKKLWNSKFVSRQINKVAQHMLQTAGANSAADSRRSAVRAWRPSARVLSPTLCFISNTPPMIRD